jgi:lipopolysaccharide/colanic/teichoic acid biosynthesis glycosyltransferase
MGLYRRRGKILFDVCMALTGLVVLAPVLLILAACVKLSDGGPVFFAQERMGRNFKKFRLFKFRTMVVGAEKIGHAVTRGHDPRITKIGAFLRHYKLDELPQLLNVLKGDMSIVGPRPEVEKYVRAFEDEYREILSIRPGITDFATLRYRNEEDILNQYEDAHAGYLTEVLPAKIALYKQYLREMGFVTDLTIIFQTLWRIVV